MDRQVERQMVAAIDKWHGLTMQDIRKLEDENMAALKEKIKSKEIAMALLLGRGGHAYVYHGCELSGLLLFVKIPKSGCFLESAGRAKTKRWVRSSSRRT